MKRNFLFITLLSAALALLSFQMINKADNTLMKKNYNVMWAQFRIHMDNDMPESAQKVLDSIEQKAEKEKNKVQLLKTILYRQMVIEELVEENPEEAYLEYAMAQFKRLGTAEQAVLHEEIATLYAAYLDENQFLISDNIAIDGSLDGVAMKYWDRNTFEKLIDQHYAEALKPVKALKKAKTEDYLCLFENPNDKYIEYEPTLFDFLFHRIATYYLEASTADDLMPEWDTQQWWLDDKNFTTANLGDSDKPIIQCLKIYQKLISENKGDLRLFNDYKRYEFINGILKDHDNYQQAMRTLMENNKSNKLYAGFANCLATSLIQQYDSSPNDSTYHDNYQKAAAICREALDAYPDSKFNCKSTLEHITHPHFEFQLSQTQLPGENIPVVVEYRNVEHPYYKIVKVEESDLDSLRPLYGEELYKALDKKKTVVEQTLNLTAETDYLKHSTIVALPPLTEGFYYIVGKTDADIKIRTARMFSLRFQVSKLGYVIDNRPNLFTMVTTDRKTGHPMEGVTVEVTQRSYNYKIRRYETVRVATLTSDRNGRVTLTDKIGHDYFNITLRKGNDVLLPQDQQNVASPNTSSYKNENTKFFTDRAIYRPGQTVYFKGITMHVENGEHTLATNLKEHVVFKDANWQDIASADFTTDEYGAFDGSFVIPTDLLNGTFRLSGKYGSTTIRVEEYKRPTFEIHFDAVKDQYKLNQEVTVHGSVDAYAGFGLDNVKYNYHVTRATSFPWRCWWWWYPAIEDETIAFGEARTDEKGKFDITFNLKPSLKTKPEQQPVFTYEIEVTATNAQGETHSDTYHIRAGYNEIALSSNIPSLVEQSETDKYNIEVLNMSGQPAKSRVERKIYRFDEDARINYFEALGQSNTTDRKVLSDNELRTLFPNYSFGSQSDKIQHKTLVYQDEVSIDEKAPFYPDKKKLEPGRYYIEMKSLDDPLAHSTREFTVYKKDSKQMPYPSMTWYRTDKSTAQPGDTVRFSIGSSANDVSLWVILTHGDEVRLERRITLNNDIQTIEYVVTEADRGGLNLQTAFIKENSYNTRNMSVSVPYSNLDLNVSLATVRDKLNPGSEETWTINVKDFKNKPVEAALLAGMYDVSLDEFAYHYWSFDMKPYSAGSRSFRTDRSYFSSSSTNSSYLDVRRLFDFQLPSSEPFFVTYNSRYFYGSKMGAPRVLYREAGGVEMVEEMAVMDAMPDVAMNQSLKTTGKTTASKDEESLSSKEEEQKSQETEQKSQGDEQAEPTLRENFNETAFFFPNLRTEADGSSTFTFTMPDAITRWKLMMIAYTKDGKTGSNRYEFKTTKPVMIMADMPRYMYDTDTLWFVANVINTGDEAVTPKAKLEIFDAATMKPVDLIASDAIINMKEIVPGRSQEVRWKVAAQYDLSLLAFRFTAYAGQFSDAEQHLMPVLSSEIFLTQTLPITVKAETEKTFDFDAIANPNSHERDYSLTLNFSTNPVWYAVQSLPYMAEIKTDRPEAAFYVFYANSLSAYIADHVPNLQAYIKKWQIETPDALLSQLEKDKDLKAIMLQETPWVLEAKSETEQRARIANLFELNTLKKQYSEALSLLEKKQEYNGGWPWMDGMPESPYITTYILSGMGRLKQMGVWESLSEDDQRCAERICKKAVKFVEYDVADGYRTMRKYNKEWSIGGFTLQELYALSFFKEQNSDQDFATAKKYYLDRLDEKKEWTDFNFNYRSFAAIVLYRNNHQNTAKLIIQSFKECAQKNEEIGMYWPKKYFSFISHIATHANIMAAFAEIDQDQEMLDQLRVWLLTQKRTNMWENTASTADAIYALLMRGSDWFEEGKNVTLSFSGTPISTEGGQAGTGFIQRRWNADEVTDAMRHLTVNNPTNHLVWGGLFRQYFVPIDEVKSDQSGFKVKRELFVETVNANGKLLVPVGKRTLKVGDKLTVKITIESNQDMSFVFVKDLRAAGFEPIEQISRYQYSDRMWYYQSNTDTDMEFFIDFLPKGTHQLEYSMFVTKEGNLSNGYALVQCQYAPEFTAYSDGMRVKVESEK
ncbi:MAG: hypothetical protein II887_07970 [Bacteroidales bacterium]|nr:hypothetical protein [Bacteroidales bacterium]